MVFSGPSFVHDGGCFGLTRMLRPPVHRSQISEHEILSQPRFVIFFGPKHPATFVLMEPNAGLLTVLGIDDSFPRCRRSFFWYSQPQVKSGNSKAAGGRTQCRRCGGWTDYGLGLLPAAACHHCYCSWCSDAQRATACSIFSVEYLV